MILRIGRKRHIRPAAFIPLEGRHIAGFTLIELIIVAVIIVVLVALSAPLFRGTFKGLELKDAAYNISKIIQYGQQRAIIEERRYRLLFDFDKKAYRLLVWDEKEKDSKLSAGGASASGGGWKEVTGRFGGYFYLPEGVRFKGEAEKITFLPNGRCDKISLYVVNKKEKIFEIKTKGRAGYVEVSEVTKK